LHKEEINPETYTKLLGFFGVSEFNNVSTIAHIAKQSQTSQMLSLSFHIYWGRGEVLSNIVLLLNIRYQ